jgi:5-methylthioadenosine/S-adenosylhomocysteine deaminase
LEQALGGELDILIENGSLLTMDEPLLIENGVVGISNGKIAALSSSEQPTSARAKRVIDARNCIVMPGFVNCHTHIASNMLLRGLLEDVQLFEWLSTMWRLKRNFDPQTLYWASLAGLVEMTRSGITCFNEHFDAYAVEPEIEALATLPLRATLGYGFADRGIYESITDWSWATLHDFERVVAEHHGADNDRIRVALSPHATYSCSAEMFRLVREVADSLKISIHTHLAEGPQELAYVQETYGTRPVQWLASLGFLDSSVTAAHCTQLDADDIALLAQSGTTIAHCPICNAKLASGTLPLREVLAAGVTVGLATDGPASHNTLDTFQEMKFAALIHKDKTGDSEFLPTHEVLRLATVGAAGAMHRPEVGRLAVGQPADLIVVDLDRPHVQPCYDPLAALVYATRADDVRYTLVDGRILLDNGEVVGLDEEDVRAKFRTAALALRDRSLV